MKKPFYLILSGFVMLTGTSCKKKSDSEPAPTPPGKETHKDSVITPVYKPLNGLQPLVIGHRGYAGLRPDHTLEGYRLAIEFGADFVEPDLVMTKDSVLVCRHEPNIGATTNVADHPEFASRKTTRNVDGFPVVDDWFVSDFTLDEIKTLKAKQHYRERSRAYDNKFDIPTFQELIDLVKAESAARGKVIGIYPETKHPTYHEQMGYRITDKVLQVLSANNLNSADAPVFLQSFEVGNLQYANSKSSVKIVQLYDAYDVTDAGTLIMQAPNGQPYDYVVSGNTQTYLDLSTNAGLDFVKTYADGIGPWKPYVIPYNNSTKQKLPATDLIQRAHARNLFVHVYTFRDDDGAGMLKEYKGDPKAEYKAFYDLGVDGVFTDYPATAVAARNNRK